MSVAKSGRGLEHEHLAFKSATYRTAFGDNLRRSIEIVDIMYRENRKVCDNRIACAFQRIDGKLVVVSQLDAQKSDKTGWTLRFGLKDLKQETILYNDFL